MREELQKVWEIVTTEIKKNKNGGDRTSLPSPIAPAAPPQPTTMSHVEKLWKVDAVLVLRANTAKPGEIVTIKQHEENMVFEGNQQSMGTFLNKVKNSKKASHVKLRDLVFASDSGFSQVFKTLLSTNFKDTTQKCLEWLSTNKRLPKVQALSRKSPEEKLRCRPEDTVYYYLYDHYFKPKNPRRPTLCDVFRVFPFIVEKYNTLKGTAITVIAVSSSSSSSSSSI